MPCDRCGAVLDPGALACPYCGAPTAAAAVHRQREAYDAAARAHWIATEEYRKAAAARARVESLATQAIVWGTIGAALSCLPLGIIGFVQGNRARALAVANKLPPPGRATTGLFFGVFSLLSSVGLVVWAGVAGSAQHKQADARIAELTREIGAHAAEATLEHATACELAEAYSLRSGFGGDNGYDLQDFQCEGVLAPRGARVELPHFRFRNHLDTESDTSVCFARGSEWFVDEVRKGECSAGKAPGAAPPPRPTAQVRRTGSEVEVAIDVAEGESASAGERRVRAMRAMSLH